VKRTGKFSEMGKYGVATVTAINESTMSYVSHAQGPDAVPAPLVAKMLD
jgi:hypothetical protein